MEASVPTNKAQQIPHIAAMSASMKGKRTYHRGLSKQIMKLNRYNARGRTHKNGMTATSWHILLVVAMRSTEAQAGNKTHNRRLRMEGSPLARGPVPASPGPDSDWGGASFAACTAQMAQPATYTVNPQP